MVLNVAVFQAQISVPWQLRNGSRFAVAASSAQTGATMRAVVQRVSSAAVHVDGRLVSSIGRGLCVLVGIHRNDTDGDVDYIVRKVLNLKLFNGDDGKRWRRSARELGLEVLCVSQFTLQCTLKGNKPDFHLAMDGDRSRDFYAEFLRRMRAEHGEQLVKDGEFGTLMQVDIRNDGPVTIELESSGFKKVPPLPQERGEPDGGVEEDPNP